MEARYLSRLDGRVPTELFILEAAGTIGRGLGTAAITIFTRLAMDVFIALTERWLETNVAVQAVRERP